MYKQKGIKIMKKTNRLIKLICLFIALMFVTAALIGAGLFSSSAATLTSCDVNSDGIVNGKDMVRVLKYIKDPTNFPYNATMDVNLDGVISRRDIIDMRSFLGQTYDISDLQYIVCDPYFRCTTATHGGKYGAYMSLDEAKAAADSKLYLGYVVYDSLGKFVYTPTESLFASKVLWNAKLVSDFADANGFTYWNADYNPGYNWQNLDINNPKVKDERISSCDRLVDWVLWRCGYTESDGNTQVNGLFVYQQMAWLESLGFVKVTDRTALQPGDIVFVNEDTTRPGNPPGHVFICASYRLNTSNYYLRYDHGSTNRIQYTQGSEYESGKAPFYEPIPASNPKFYYAYRLPQ